MKKLTRKLFLSVAALAVCAATLVSTTFAWYVTNSTASVGDITGSTATASTDGNLLVAHASADGIDGDYSPSISFATKGLKQVVDLSPVTKKATGFVNRDNGDVANTAAYIEYKFYMLSTSKTTVYVTTTVTNSSTIAGQKVYSSEGTGKNNGETLKIDAVRALRMEVVQGGTATVKADGIYDLQAISGYTPTTADDWKDGTTNAHTYYDAVNGGDADAGISETTPAKTTFDSITVVAGEDTLITVRVWLEGTDTACFDSCSGQDFSINFAFTTDAKND